MLEGLYEKLAGTSPAAVVIISVSIILFTGFAATRLTKLLKLPNVTAYIVVGVVIGPYCLNLIPGYVINGMDFIADIALAFIAFSVGEFFRLPKLRENGPKVAMIAVFDAAVSSVLVFVLTYYVFSLSLALSIVLASLASATAPSSTVMTIRQTGSKGDFVDTLLQVLALDDMISLAAFSVAVSVALSSVSGNVPDTGIKIVGLPILINTGVLLLGGLFGFLMKLLMPKKRSTDNRLIISISMLFAFCGICAMLGVSPLLGCMSMGMVYINVTSDEKLFKQLNYFSPPVLLLFFVRSGMKFRLDALTGASVSAGTVPLIAVSAAYVAVRMIGKYAGAFAGCAATGKRKDIRNYLGLALMPQAGVTIGLAELGSRTLGEGIGDDLMTVMLASGVIYEIIGPVCAKIALYRTHSYSDKLEDITAVSELTESGREKTEAELLIERIQVIQKELPAHPAISEEEQAFDDAAEEQYEMMEYLHNKKFRKNR